MKQVYSVLNSLKDHFESNGITNKVLFGSENEVDSDKTQNMPCSNIELQSCSFNGPVMSFPVSILCLGWVKELKTVDPDNDYYGSSNLFDVLNEQHFVIGKLIRDLDEGNLFDEFVRLSGSPSANVVMDFGGNSLAGWRTTIELETKNEISVC